MRDFIEVIYPGVIYARGARGNGQSERIAQLEWGCGSQTSRSDRSFALLEQDYVVVGEDTPLYVSNESARCTSVTDGMVYEAGFDSPVYSLNNTGQNERRCKLTVIRRRAPCLATQWHRYCGYRYDPGSLPRPVI